GVASNNAPAIFPIGMTTVRFAAVADAAGNIPAPVSATVNVTDSVAPVIATPSSITVEATSSAGTAKTQAAIAAFLASATTTDVVSGAGVASNNAPAIFPIGMTTVRFAAVADAAGNIPAPVSATVTIVSPAAPTAPTAVNMTVNGKVLNFTWLAGNWVDHYRLLVNPDGASGFSVIPSAANISALVTKHALEISAHKTNWLAAQYILEACNADASVCAASPNQTVALIDSIAATVFVKASNTDTIDHFGWSLSLSGDGNTLAVGAFTENSNATGIDGNQLDNTARNSGAVYVFVRSGSAWVQQAYLKASNARPNAKFGNSVSLSQNGNTLAVGSSQEKSSAVGVGGNQTDTGAMGSGAVYVFNRSGISWVQQAYVKASNTGVFHNFGCSVSLSGDGNTLAVGAMSEGNAAGGNQAGNPTRSGAVYVFSRTALSWVQQAYLKASNVDLNDNFATSVSLSHDGNTLAVGAGDEDSAAVGIGGNQSSNAALGSGAAYVFFRTGGIWAQQAYIKASNTGAGDRFSQQVSLSGDGNTLAVGAYGEGSAATGINGNQGSNAAINSGAVYVFSRIGAIWTQQAYLKASNTGAGDSFGVSINLSSDATTLAVGATLERSNTTGIGGNQQSNAHIKAGAVYVFSRSGTNWVQESYVKASNTRAKSSFGIAVGLSGNGSILAVGASDDSNAIGVGGNQANAAARDSGAVYLY
ncbi:MAG: hypothetical protein Q9M19_04535, partial [Mariprofundaceae bacterium]|nr:hypothetical protein [Mariprofundaceae bacterium]